ncbi:alanine racemase [Psittacicella gerlachiana]|uniref:alanine racemase n=1 Tax=Psittacicella gerlachiana TaxID=2028574 RepID=A0A3A1Y7R1_9GAMM|nr:alanine racemase [Psittacicella gerlachiana]RIY32124.1 alanine racemase [Psittacicella gerlachiana]
MRYPKAVINTKTLQHNISLIQDQNPEAHIIALVNANAYGHGIIEISRALDNNVAALATTRLDEAETIRDNGVNTPIIVLQGFTNLVELFKVVDLKVQVVVSNEMQLELIEQYQEHLSGLKIWLLLQSPKNYLGFNQEQISQAYKGLRKIKGIRSIGLMTYTDSQEAIDLTAKHPFTDLALMDNQIKHLPDLPAQIWLSSGVQLYGLESKEFYINNLITVMNLETLIVQIHYRKAGDQIGYGSTYTVTQDTYIGVVAMGYGDGYPRNAPTGTPVWVNGREVPIVGRVSMDMLTVDLGQELIDKVGDKVYLWGDKLNIEKVSSKVNIADYELTSYLTERVKHEFN